MRSCQYLNDPYIYGQSGIFFIYAHIQVEPSAMPCTRWVLVYRLTCVVDCADDCVDGLCWWLGVVGRTSVACGVFCWDKCPGGVVLRQVCDVALILRGFLRIMPVHAKRETRFDSDRAHVLLSVVRS